MTSKGKKKSQFKQAAPKQEKWQSFYCGECMRQVRMLAISVDEARKAHYDECNGAPEMWIADPAAEEAQAVPRAAAVPVVEDAFVCTHGNCKFVAKTESGLKSHMRKHEREDKAAAAEAEAAKNDPAKASLDGLKEILNSYISKTTETVNQITKKTEVDSAFFQEINDLDDLINTLNDESLPALMAVPEVYQDEKAIDELHKLISVSVSRLAMLKADMRFVRGRKASKFVANCAIRDERMADVNEHNQKVEELGDTAARKWADGHITRFNAMLSGELWVPFKDKQQYPNGLPFVRETYIQLGVMLKQLGIGYKERTMDKVEGCLSELFWYQMKRYCFPAGVRSFNTKVQKWALDDDNVIVVLPAEIVRTEAELPLDEWNLTLNEAIRKVHTSVFNKGFWNNALKKYVPEPIEPHLKRMGYLGTGKVLLGAEFVSSGVNSPDMTTMRAAWQDALDAQQGEIALVEEHQSGDANGQQSKSRGRK